VKAQNVGGIRTEASKRTRGIKFSVLKKLENNKTDFFILSETKAQDYNLQNRKINKLIPTLLTSQNIAAGGVAIFSHAQHKLISNSKRESQTKGHYVMGVYEVQKTKIIIVGVYGNPDSNDAKSKEIFDQMNEHIAELKHLHSTGVCVVAGDFNCHLNKNDSSKQFINKTRTVGAICSIMDTYNMYDIAESTNKTHHTYFRHKAQEISSRIDLILTNINTQSLKFETTHTIFDHLCTHAIIGQTTFTPKTNMYDHILSSDEFLIKFTDNLQSTLTDYGLTNNQNNFLLPNVEGQTEEEIDNENFAQQIALPTADSIQDINRKLNEQNTNAITVFNEIIHCMRQTHDDILKQKAQHKRNRALAQQNEMNYITRRLKRQNTAEQAEALKNRYTDIQQEIKNEIEMKDTAKESRISTFYKANTGKNVPITYTCTKEKRNKTNITCIQKEDGTLTTDEEDIHTIMQNWYKDTADKPHDQGITLQDFLTQQKINLPKITDEQAEFLEEEFSTIEIYQAIQAANETSASGISGQSISMYKLLFLEIPELFTAAMNQLVFLPGLMESEELRWIRRRKVIWIPKKSPALHPRDYRPLSMLEVLYKIPARIMSKRLSSILSTIINPNQHGFMPKRGIQEPSLLMTHIIQEANYHNTAVQIISYDIEKAFDRVSHKIIVQALREFGIPEIMIMAIRHFSLIGYAQVEINGKLGTAFVIRIGSGQGDPLSAILYIIATEPGNLAIIQNTKNIQYNSPLGIQIAPQFYADDNRTCLQLSEQGSIEPVHKIYNDFTLVSGLKINYAKSEALCINTSEVVKNELMRHGLTITDKAKCLGITLSKNIHETINSTMENIDPKAIKKRILIASAPTNMFHKAILFNRVITPIYNHVFMALPYSGEKVNEMYSELVKFLWTSTKDNIPLSKRKLVAQKRLNANFEMGGLQIQHPQDVITGMQLNLIQKHVKNQYPQFSQILNALLQSISRPNIEQHIKYLGPMQWEKTGNKLKNINILLAQTMESVSTFIQTLETDISTWHLVPIYGHSLAQGLSEITYQEFRALFETGTFTIGQLLNKDELTGQYTKELTQSLETNPTIEHRTIFKLKLILGKIKFSNFNEIIVSPTPIFEKLIQGKNLSQLHKKIKAKEKSRSIKKAPAYNTRIKDRIMVPDSNTFTAAYGILNNPIVPLKTKEISFQILNRTLWTNNKACKSNMSDTNLCRFCDEIETVEHAILQCENYAALQWEMLGQILTDYIRQKITDAPSIQLTYLTVIYNKELQNIGMYIKDKNIRKIVMLLVFELRRNIYFHRSNSTAINRIPVLEFRRIAHFDSVIKKLDIYLEYLSGLKWKSAREFLKDIRKILLDKISEE